MKLYITYTGSKTIRAKCSLIAKDLSAVKLKNHTNFKRVFSELHPQFLHPS